MTIGFDLISHTFVVTTHIKATRHLFEVVITAFCFNRSKLLKRLTFVSSRNKVKIKLVQTHPYSELHFKF